LDDRRGGEGESEAGESKRGERGSFSDAREVEVESVRILRRTESEEIEEEEEEEEEGKHSPNPSQPKPFTQRLRNKQIRILIHERSRTDFGRDSCEIDVGFVDDDETVPGWVFEDGDDVFEGDEGSCWVSWGAEEEEFDGGVGREG